MKKLLIFCFGIALGVFVAVNTLGLMMGEFIYRELTSPHLYQNLFNLQDNSKNIEKIATAEKKYEWEKVGLTSPHGYTIRGTYIPANRPSKQTILFLHGLFQNRSSGLDYLDIYQELGYNVLIVDARGHGDSGGGSISWGYFEKDDINVWLDWLEQKTPQGIIGIHGISMGAATALLHTDLNESTHRVSFYIADSSYDDFKDLLIKQLTILAALPEDSKALHTILFYTQIAAYYHDRFTFDQISPLLAVQHTTTPILYLHGQKDTLIPPQMSQDLYNATAGAKELHFFPDTPHASAVYYDKETYAETIRAFIEKNTRK
jgi:uncharacterized protein